MKAKLEWVKEHKKEILIGTGMVIGTAVLIGIGIKRAKSSDALVGDLFASDDKYALIDTIKNSTEELELTPKVVDEDIFTKLAPAIEEAVLNKDLDNVVLDRPYRATKIGENLWKVVTVKVENVYGD